MRYLLALVFGVSLGWNFIQYEDAKPLRADAERWQAIQNEEVEVRLHRPSGSVLIKIPGVDKPALIPKLCPPSLAM